MIRKCKTVIKKQHKNTEAELKLEGDKDMEHKRLEHPYYLHAILIFLR